MNYLGLYDPTYTPTKVLAILLKESIKILIISAIVLLATVLILIFYDFFSAPKQEKR
ncbi:MAG: hypothetical protein GTO17_13360 [Candidatus Aminicenantes bacterium]|nr:hypothetical protein [Candidatus Aminicenantes bacterium]